MTAKAAAKAAPAGGKIRYPERWMAFDEEERLRIAGSPGEVEELDALVEMLGDLDDEARTARLEELRPQLVSVVARLDTTVAHAERLRRQRRKLFAQLLLLGEQAAKIGTLADISAVAVSHETGVTVKKR